MSEEERWASELTEELRNFRRHHRVDPMPLVARYQWLRRTYTLSDSVRPEMEELVKYAEAFVTYYDIDEAGAVTSRGQSDIDGHLKFLDVHPSLKPKFLVVEPR